MNVLQISISAAILILIIIAIRAFVAHRLPKKTFMLLWGVVLLRLLIPFHIPLSLSVHTVAERSVMQDSVSAYTQVINHRIITENVSIYEPNELVYAHSLGQGEPQIFTQASSIIIFWAIGAIILFLFFIITHIRFSNEHKGALPLEHDYACKLLHECKFKRPVKLLQSDRINTPVTYGILKPVILFPKIRDWHDDLWLKHALTHEITHVKHFDILTKWVLAIVLCIHWFNPLVWVMFVLANRDIEVVCDEAVIHIFGENTKTAYALTLIGLEERRSGLSSLTVNFAKNATEERIKLIMKTKKKSVISAVVTVIFVSAIALNTLIVNAGHAPAHSRYATVEDASTSGYYGIIEVSPTHNHPKVTEVEYVIPHTVVKTPTRFYYLPATPPADALPLSSNACIDKCCFDDRHDGDVPIIPYEVREFYNAIFTRLLIEIFGHDDLQIAYEQLGSDEFAVAMDLFFDKFNARYGGSHYEHGNKEATMRISPRGPCSRCNGTMVVTENPFTPRLIDVTSCGHNLSDSNLRFNEHWEQWTSREWRCRTCNHANPPQSVRRTWINCFRR